MKSRVYDCIYCSNSDPNKFAGREHVLPQAFGKFGSKTPTLDCVCDECNSYFSRELDQVLARETLEGVTRYKNAKYSTEQRPQRKLRFSLADDAEAGEFKGAVIGGVDPTTGKLLPLETQLQIRNCLTDTMDVFLQRDIDKIDLPPDIYGHPGERKLQIFAPSKESHDAFVSQLNQRGFDIRLGEPFAGLPAFEDPSLEGQSILVHIEGEVDNTHKRALAKILVNFGAYHLGCQEVQKPEWEIVKRFVRYKKGLLGARFSHKPFWDGQETDELRFPSDSINVRIENHQRGLVGAIQFFNHPTYELLLAENYRIEGHREVAYRFTPGSEPVVGQRRPKDSSILA